MSQRHMSDNLRYFIDNQGLQYNAPEIDISTNTPTVQGTFSLESDSFDLTVGMGQLFGNYTLNTDPIMTGTLLEGRNIHIEGSPNKTISAQYPRHSSFSKNFNLLANTPQVLDWTGNAQGQDSFPLAPSIGNCLDYVNLVGGTTTDWKFSNGGYYDFFIRCTPTVTLGANQEIKAETRLSTNAGGSWSLIQTDKEQVGGAGSLSVDFLGGKKTFIYAPQGATPGDQRISFVLTCTEAKTVTAEVFWILCGRDV